jgi:hypothetical protein
MLAVCGVWHWLCQCELPAATSTGGASGTQTSSSRNAVRTAIEDLTATFGGDYPRGREFLARLDALERRAKTASAATAAGVQTKIDELAREALLANPLVCGQPLLCVTRHQYASDHHATETMFQNGEIAAASYRGGGGLRVLDLARGGQSQTIVDAGLDGVCRDPEVSFDGRRIVFSMRRGRDDDYHVYEVDADGRNLRQLTCDKLVADIDPAYLPDGKIVFSSTRDVKYCQCNRHISPNLFVMNADGRDVLQIGHNNLPELHASLMPDGRVLYDRWEYVDRQFGPSYGLWTCNPDGTNHALYYGSNAWSPGAIIDARVIPGGQQVVCIFGSCHDRPWGALAIIDRRLGMNGPDPVVRIWPPHARELLKRLDNFSMGDVGHIDAFKSVWPKYEDPWPLADAAGRGAGKYFLVARSVSREAGERMGIFLVDVFGNELLVHDEAPGCFDPMPLSPRRTPPLIPARIDRTKADGYFYVENVYRGTGMERVAPGTIKYLRIIEAPPKRTWTQAHYGIDATQAPAMNWNLTVNKRILGDVPVEADGSAYFSVPAGKFVYFQALDARKMMVQSMRSGTTLMPGEVAGCVGCHEERLATSASMQQAAMRRPPSVPQPWFGPEREFNYLSEVQPVWNRHCIGCHDYGKSDSTLNLSGDLGVVFNTSYVELLGRSPVRWAVERPNAPKALIKAVHDGPPGVLPAYAWGAQRSRLLDFLTPAHHGVRMPPEDFQRVATWIDLNVPYYGSYFAVYGENPFGRSPLTARQLARLGELAEMRARPNSRQWAGSPPLDFTRPERSPLLQNLDGPNDPRYLAALAILRAGAEQLARQPREDMLGPRAQPVTAEDRSRMERYEKYASQAAELVKKHVLEEVSHHPERSEGSGPAIGPDSSRRSQLHLQ